MKCYFFAIVTSIWMYVCTIVYVCMYVCMDINVCDESFIYPEEEI